MLFEQIRIGHDNFCYLIGDEETLTGAVVDPGTDPEKALRRIRELRLNITWVINTHSHFDHTSGNSSIAKATDARLAGCGLAPPARSLADGDLLPVGGLQLEIIHTPGHTPDSICILAENRLITGDTLFVTTIGKTGFGDDARRIFESLQTKIKPLSDEVEVYPGHDYGPRPVSTIGWEKQHNPFLQCETFGEFIELKHRRKRGR